MARYAKALPDSDRQRMGEQGGAISLFSLRAEKTALIRLDLLRRGVFLPFPCCCAAILVRL
jgi:hypothetical protein